MGGHFTIVFLLAGLYAIGTVPMVDSISSFLCGMFDGGDYTYGCSSYSYWSSMDDREDLGAGVHVGVKPNKAIYLGCYTDARDHALPDAQTLDNSMSPALCFDYCWSRNMRYAGMGNSNQCYCGLEGTNYAIHGARPDSECSSYCRGDYSSRCGGYQKISVYDLKNSTHHRENDIRLINYHKKTYNYRDWYRGMVEIHRKDEWAAICDEDWGIKEAAVVCRQLGYGAPKDIYSDGDDKDESIPDEPKNKISIAFADVTCKGAEMNLANCVMEEWSSASQCGNITRVWVECKGPRTAPELQISHLEGGDDKFGGIVVYNYDGIQGFLCNNSWDMVDASVVCHELGFGPAITYRQGNHTYTRTTDGIFLLGNIECSDSDKRNGRPLSNCSHSQWANTGCVPGQEATVRCHPPGISGVRLADGPSKHEGRLELFHGGKWGTVCDIGWDIEDADVACHMLGYPWAVSTTPNRYRYYYTNDLQASKERKAHWYGEATGPIHFTQVDCQGLEFNLNECVDPDDPSFTPSWSCDHTEDVGIKCANKTDTEHFAVHLVDGQMPQEGRVEVKYQGEWGTVCDDNWDLKDASVVCRQLGYGNAIKAVPGSTYGDAMKDQLIIMDDVNCTGRELLLSDCPHITWNNHNCRHHEDAGVKCQGFNLGDLFGNGPNRDRPNGDGPPQRPDFINWRPGGGGRPDTSTDDRNTPAPPRRGTQVRLVGGSKKSEGRVEVSYKGQWGTVCSNRWDIKDANVVCLQLGYSGAAEDGKYRDFGAGSGDILLSDVDCVGQERWIDYCSHAKWGENDCTHQDDAAAVCIDDTVNKMAVRLVDGSTNSEGHVEILRNGIWGAVCDVGWDEYDAGVVCRQMGYQDGAVKATESSFFGASNSPITVSNVYCRGDENTLSECSLTWSTSRCDGNDRAGVVCKTTGEVKAAGSSSSSALSAGMGSGITLGALFLLIILVVLLVIVIFSRRNKRAPDTIPIIPPSQLSVPAVSFSNMMGEQNQAIGGAIGGMVLPPPVYTPTEIKVPLDGSGVSAAAMVVPQGGAAVVPQGAVMGPPNINDNGISVKSFASAPIELEGATLDQVSL